MVMTVLTIFIVGDVDDVAFDRVERDVDFDVVDVDVDGDSVWYHVTCGSLCST